VNRSNRENTRVHTHTPIKKKRKDKNVIIYV